MSSTAYTKVSTEAETDESTHTINIAATPSVASSSSTAPSSISSADFAVPTPAVASSSISDYFYSITSAFGRVTGEQQAAPTAAINNNSSAQATQSPAAMIDNLTAQFNAATQSNNSNGAVSESTSGLLHIIKTREWRATLRSPTVFAAPSCFSKPRTSTEAGARLEQNLRYYGKQQQQQQQVLYLIATAQAQL